MGVLDAWLDSALPDATFLDVTDTPAHILDQLMRDSYGKLLAFVAARTRDISLAEDVVSEAFAIAMETWPRDGVPTNPFGWLMRSAVNRFLDAARRNRVDHQVRERVGRLQPEAYAAADLNTFSDERLSMMFTCAHPALAANIRTPLLLQCVLGLSAERIASAMLMSPATIGQQLVRAKRKIRDAGFRFEPPEPEHLPDRLGTVLESIYAAYTTEPTNDAQSDLADEAIRLARLAAELLPEQPEAIGLVSLLLYSRSRRAARRSDDGLFVPIGQQDVSRWDHAMIDEAEACLKRAASFKIPGRFQIEASIQSVHAARRQSGHVNWPMIVAFYERLLSLADTVGARVSYASALHQAGNPAAALAELRTIDPKDAHTYQSYWAVLGSVLRQHDVTASRQALSRAAALSTDASVQAFLLSQSSS